MSTIMVHMGEKQWTAQAVHMAAAIARNRGAPIHLVRMIPVQHVNWLGTELGDAAFSQREYADFMDYCRTAEDYGVNVCLCQMQYHTLHEAIAEAAEHLDADVVFATLPAMRVRLWRKFLLWQLARRLDKGERRLFALEPASGVENWIPSITFPSSKKHNEETPQPH